MTKLTYIIEVDAEVDLFSAREYWLSGKIANFLRDLGVLADYRNLTARVSGEQIPSPKSLPSEKLL